MRIMMRWRWRKRRKWGTVISDIVSGNAAKVIVLCFCSGLCKCVHLHALLNATFWFNRSNSLNINQPKTKDMCTFMYLLNIYCSMIVSYFEVYRVSRHYISCD